ncbi:MAG: telomerase inhibitor, partial [Trizodia sp. TS-e1964]
MGLSEPRKRFKLSHDPNNTNWSRSTTNFGHKILTSQGWTPGDYLGPKDAPHAKYYTAANSSHIRISIKDDNLGLGAKKGSGQAIDECTGLDAFQGLLGRLNGKSDSDLEMEANSRSELKRKTFIERRWGVKGFISAGFLVGDKIKAPEDSPTTHGPPPRQPIKAEESLQPKSDILASATKKPKAKIENTMERDGDPAKRTKKSRRTAIEDDGAETGQGQSAASEKKSRRGYIADFSPIEGADLQPHVTPDNAPTPMGLNAREERRKRKLERREKKEARRQRKRERGEAELCATNAEPAQCAAEQSAAPPTLKAGRKAGINAPSTEPTTLSGGRHAVRQRYIQQKRLAVMDSKSLNEVVASPPTTYIYDKDLASERELQKFPRH